MSIEIREATLDDLVLLPALERRADGIFTQAGIPLDAPCASERELRSALQILVAGRPPAGFARLEQVGGLAHLEQLSVDPPAMRRGIGGRLLEAACEWAAGAGYTAVTLMTFRDVVWNGPLYARHGFVEIVPSPALHPRVVHERELGLDRLGVRVAMRRDLRRSSAPLGLAGDATLGPHFRP